MLSKVRLELKQHMIVEKMNDYLIVCYTKEKKRNETKESKEDKKKEIIGNMKGNVMIKRRVKTSKENKREK